MATIYRAEGDERIRWPTTGADSSNGPPLLQLTGVSKSFPGVQALRDVSFDLRAGEIHALVGENGAGKSTLIKIICGVHQPDAGTMLLRGELVRFNSAQMALRMGISTVHQEFNYCPDLNVVENIYFGRSLPTRLLGIVDWPAARRRAKQLFDSLGVAVDLNAPMGSISPTLRKVVEVARALVYQADILVFDEPTSALPEEEAEKLFDVIRALAAMNVGVIYITHRLQEVFKIANRVTVLRDGEKIAARPIAEVSPEQLIRMMVGRPIGNLFAKQDVEIGEVVLEVDHLTRQGAFKDVSFRLRRGEILGLGGLVGAGRSEVAQAIAGMHPADSGTIRIRGAVRRIRDVGEAMKAGIAYVPEDRQMQGLVLGMSIADNETLPSLEHFSQGLLISRPRQLSAAKDYAERLRLAYANLLQPVRRLSGGNQQKVVLGKWLMTQPQILILDEPARGIDVGAKAEIHALMSSLAAQGVSIILISSELPELLAMSDRVLALHEGRITGEFRHEEATQEAIMHAATGNVTLPAERSAEE